MSYLYYYICLAMYFPSYCESQLGKFFMLISPLPTWMHCLQCQLPLLQSSLPLLVLWFSLSTLLSNLNTSIISWLFISKSLSLQDAFILVPMSLLSPHGEYFDRYWVEHLQFHAGFCVPLKPSTDIMVVIAPHNGFLSTENIQNSKQRCSLQTFFITVLRLQHQSTAMQVFPIFTKTQQKYSWQ